MIEPPDVNGFPLDEALERCKTLGFEVEILITRPVKALTEGKPRVARFNRVSKNKVVLTVVFENKERGGG